MLIRDCFALQPQEKKLVVHFLFDGFRLALLRPRIGGGEQGWTSFRFLRLLMFSPQPVFKVNDVGHGVFRLGRDRCVTAPSPGIE